MKSVNKIKERDMDPEFLLSLMNNVTSVNVKELLRDYVRKDEVIPVSSLPTDYLNSFNDSLTALQNEISEVKEQYRNKTVKIKLEDLDKDSQDLFSAMLYFLQRVKMQDDTNPVITYSPEGDRVIVIVDDEGNEYNVIIPTFYDSSSNFSAIDKARLENQITMLQNQVNSLTSTVNTMRRQLSTGTISTAGTYNVSLGNLDYSTIENDTVRELLVAITSQAAKVKNLEESLDNLTGGSSELSLNMIVSRLNQCEDDISNINSYTSRQVKLSDLAIDLQQTINTIADLQRRTTLVEENKMNLPVLDQSGYLYYSLEEGKAVKSRPPIIKATMCLTVEDIVDAQSNNEKFIVNLQNGEGYQFNSVNKAYDIIQIEKNPEYEFALFLNTATETIEYFVINGTIARINSANNTAALINSAHLTVKKVNMVAASSYRMERLNNLRKFPPLILVYDFESNSRTVGQYINGEGVTTVSHDADGFTVYNDSLYELEVLIMAGD